MSTVKGIYAGNAWQNVGACLLARIASIYGSGAASPDAGEGNIVQQADISTITVASYDADGQLVGSVQTPAASAVIYDTIQTTAVWTDYLPRGGNFRYFAPASMFPTGSVKNRIEMLITLTDGHKIPARWELDVIGRYGS